MRGASDGWSERGRVRRWKALAWGGVIISEVGWLYLCGASRRAVVVWAGERRYTQSSEDDMDKDLCKFNLVSVLTCLPFCNHLNLKTRHVMTVKRLRGFFKPTSLMSQGHLNNKTICVLR